MILEVGLLTEISPELQEQLRELQSGQQQLQAIVSQRMQADLMVKETERTLKVLEKLPADEKIYKAVGRILISSDKKSVESELSESKETLGVRMKSIERQEAKLKEKLSDMQKTLEAELKPHTGG